MFSRLNRFSVLYALYLALEEFVPGQPALGSDAIVLVSLINEHCVLGPATHVGVVVASSYIRVLPLTSEFLNIANWLAHGSVVESAMHV